MTKTQKLKNYYSNGKLLLTGEYLVLDGAKSLAVPTKFGQDLIIDKIKELQLIWASFTNKGECWFESVFDLQKLRLVNCTFNSDKEGSAEFIAETLLDILKEAKRLNPDFLNSETGFVVKTQLTFPRNWGLGSSSTLINSIASWAKVDAFQLLWNSFKGSGYDIACAQNDSPIFYQIEKDLLPEEFIDVLDSQGIISYFIFSHLDGDRERYTEYSRAEFLNDFIVDDILFDEFVDYCVRQNYSLDFYEYEGRIKMYLKATLAEQLFDTNAYAKIKSDTDRMLQKVIELDNPALAPLYPTPEKIKH